MSYVICGHSTGNSIANTTYPRRCIPMAIACGINMVYYTAIMTGPPSSTQTMNPQRGSDEVNATVTTIDQRKSTTMATCDGGITAKHTAIMTDLRLSPKMVYSSGFSIAEPIATTIDRPI